MTIDNVRAFQPEVVVFGIGSTEPHGPHLPYGTDYFQCDGLCRRAVIRANEKGGKVLMYPTLPIGNNVNMKAFPFACRVRVRTLMNIILDVIEAVEEDGVRKMVLVSGHGGNTDTMRAAMREHMERHPPGPNRTGAFVCLASGHSFVSDEARKAIVPPHPAGDHGGQNETSRIMYLRHDLVQKHKIGDQPIGKPLIEATPLGKVHYVRPWHLHIPLGCGGGGDTREASEEKGRNLVESSAEGFADFLVELSKMPWNPNFPYPA